MIFLLKIHFILFIHHGSTGKPKGALLCHRNVVRLIKNDSFQFDFNEADVWPMFHSVAFDVSVWEMYGTLLNGAKLILVPEDIAQDPAEFLNLLRKENVTVLDQTPTYFYNLLAEELKRDDSTLKIRYIIFAGEALKPCLIKPWKDKYPFTRLINMYGITETTVHVTFKDLSNEDLLLPKSNIGVPIPTLKMILLDKNLKLVPYDVPGEIGVIGDGVFKGYLNRPDLNSTKLIRNPYDNSQIMYRSGDSAILHKDGSFEYCKRIDTQIKIRGFRVELGEIEEKILNFKNISSCVVAKKTDEFNHDILCAYYVKSGPVDINNLKLALKKDLASYMIPQYFIDLPSLPYNHNGKINRDALPLPEVFDETKEIIAPRNDIDATLIDILKVILHVNTISIDDSFLDLGGDSLCAMNFCTMILDKLGVQVYVKDVLSKPVILDLSDYIQSINLKASTYHIEKSVKREFYPLSSAQKRIYYASSLDNNSTLYNIAGGIVINNCLDTNKIKACFDALIERHASLRTHFEIRNNDIVQIVDDNVDFNFDVSTSTTDNLNDIYSSFVKPFDLSLAPLFRAKLIKLNDNKMLLLLDMHHIISDGTSLSILLQELCDLYNGSSLPEKQIDYTDFALWEKDQFETDEFNNLKDFWVGKFSDEIPLLNMPTSYKRPAVQSFKGNNYHKKLSCDVFNKVTTISKKLNITPYMFMLSCYYILLSKYTSSNDIVVGTPIIGRDNSLLNNVIGMFVNTLALRNKIDSSLSFSEFSKIIKENCVDSFKNQAYPFDMLVKDLNIKRDVSRNPLFDVMFVYQSNGYPNINFKNTTVDYFIPDNDVSKFDLTLEIVPINDEYSLRFEYCTELFDEDFIKRLSSHYINILNAILENCEVKIADIDMLSEEERNQILYDFNDTKLDYPKNKTIVNLFEEQVAKTPDNIAVVFEDKKLTYRELNEKANQLACKLNSMDIKSGDVVGVCLNRSIELLVSICALFKLGAVYMPMYIGYPKDRLTYMLKNSNAKLLITSSNNKLRNFDDVEKLFIDSINDIDSSCKINLAKNFSSSSTAYIIYTSGSTGKPKGVQISNRNLINFIYAFNKYFGSISSNDIFLSSTNISFDVSIFELFLPILTGAQVVLYPEDVIKNIALYCDIIVNNKITALYIPPNILNEVYDLLKDKTVYIKKILVGVEAIRKSTLNKYLKMIPDLKIINGYGPTETTICCTAFEYSLDETNDSLVSIGHPLFNNQIFILSTDKTLQPIGVIGEIYVAGDGVGIGYINDSNKTSLNYVPSKYNATSPTMYKTGDLAKWNSDGTICFIGRNDSQIKISGHRIELNEINHVINSYPNVEKSFSTTYSFGSTTGIVSYFTADRTVSIKDLNAFLQSQLADYMVPNFIIQVSKFPLTSNGKIDKNKLPKNFINSSKEYVEPRNSFENSIVEIWKKLFFINNIGINDNFFDLGGDSLIAIKFQIEAMNIGLNITYADIFSYPTIKQLSEKSNNSNCYNYNDASYNYSKIDALIAKNRIENILPNKYTANHEIGNILLIGATGFLGIHLLDYYLSTQSGIVYCLIREKDSLYPEERLKKISNFYFGDKYNDLFGKRIIVINGDMTLPKFNLSDVNYKNLGQNVNAVINSAALVKHYGNYKLFNDTNVIGTTNIINFCETFNKKLYHISTLSVSGSGVFSGKNTDIVSFSEDNFYIGQDLNNIYIYTKFEAEKIIFERILSGSLNACILRIGNITNRFSDGKFQINVSENAFVNRLKSIFKLGVIQKKFLEHSLEFTPVDVCSKAIVKIIQSNPEFSVFHLFNSNLLRIDTLLNYLDCLNRTITCVDDKDFSCTIEKFLSNDELKNDIAGIITDLDKDKLLNLIAHIIPNDDFTINYLTHLGFQWPEIDIDYIKKYLHYFDSINFLD